ncbi:MAG: HpcH/HpaI aldolase family protein [Brevirhabdus sp.]
MKAPANPLKAALAKGDTALGLWMNLGHPGMAELAAGAGFDFCLIDGEHAPYDPNLILHQLQAMEGAGASAVVRVPVGEAWIIKQVLDLGAQSLLVPMVDSGDEAAQMVRATRYAPAGIRGQGASVTRSAAYGRRADYTANANDEICLIVQAESRAAIEDIDAIAAVDGVDAVFIGPSDLSADMGHLGNTTHPEVAEAIAHGFARIRAAGKAGGIIANSADQIMTYMQMGANFVAVGSDVILLRQAMEGRLADIRGRMAK